MTTDERFAVLSALIDREPVDADVLAVDSITPPRGRNWWTSYACARASRLNSSLTASVLAAHWRVVDRRWRCGSPTPPSCCCRWRWAPPLGRGSPSAGKHDLRRRIASCSSCREWTGSEGAMTRIAMRAGLGGLALIAVARLAGHMSVAADIREGSGAIPTCGCQSGHSTRGPLAASKPGPAGNSAVTPLRLRL